MTILHSKFAVHFYVVLLKNRLTNYSIVERSFFNWVVENAGSEVYLPLSAEVVIMCYLSWGFAHLEGSDKCVHVVERWLAEKMSSARTKPTLLLLFSFIFQFSATLIHGEIWFIRSLNVLFHVSHKLPDIPEIRYQRLAESNGANPIFSHIYLT